jgi:UDP-N-acetylmuramoyl-tripeptide--D-alanyl-D-alanine ligase
LTSLPASNRIVITPGFVEVGATNEEVHEAFGKQLVKHCDYLGLVQSGGSAAIQKGWLAAGGEHDKIIPAQSQEEAVAKLQPFIVPNSVILFENNLPEVYN